MPIANSNHHWYDSMLIDRAKNDVYSNEIDSTQILTPPHVDAS